MMGKALVIVESPAKAKTIKKYLGKGFSVMASVGHVIDLPVKEIGVDVDADFAPKYVVIRGKTKVLKQITDAAKKVDEVFLAPDPDREGEAIAWHIAEKIRKGAKGRKKSDATAGPIIHRATFNEITKKAVQQAIANPGELNQHLFEAQQARRVLDRLVGYKISPLLWDKVRRGLSAGRVQSVAVRIVCERESEIEAFESKEYWSVVVHLEGSKLPVLDAKLVKIDGKDVDIGDGTIAGSVVEELKGQAYKLESIKRRERKRNPSPPFITSKLQQEAARKLGYTAKKTMAMAQMLYEGIELGDEGAVGLITYMRTDSTKVADEAIGAVRNYILDRFGDAYLPKSPVTYKNKKSAQEAHEAIRPTSLDYPPEVIKEHLTRDAFRLYELIWKRFVASQMMPAMFDQTSLNVAAGRFSLRATGQVMRFAGFIAVYLEGVDDEAQSDEDENPNLPDLEEGEDLKLIEVEPFQHFTQPPPRFTEASLVKELEEQGIGRPSTYASIMSTIQDKGYVQKVEKRFHPSELGRLVNDLLVENFPSVLSVGFTAEMEHKLDEIEEGNRGWVVTLRDFYEPFVKVLAEAKKSMRNVKREVVETEIDCEKCGNKMVIKWGKHGEFLACSTYPDCRSTKEFKRSEDGSIVIQEAKETDEICDQCGSPMIVRRGKFGEFLACSSYPDCKTTRSIGTGVKCPDCEVGEVVQKSTRRGRSFYGCNKYPKCKFASWDKPIAEKCPECGSSFLVEKYSRKTGETNVACPNKECGYKKLV
jgi:DNA topoisomerase I